MAHLRIGLAAAVATVLALTAAVPASAVAAAPGAVAADQQQAPLTYPQKSDIVSAGATGFLTKGEKLLWTRFADGAVVELPGTPVGDSHSDTVTVQTARNVFQVYDMAAGGEPVTIDWSSRPGDYEPQAVHGSTTAFWYLGQVVLASVENGKVTERKVGGSYESMSIVSLRAGEVLVTHRLPYDATSTTKLDVLDTATGAVKESFTIGSRTGEYVAASDTALAWPKYGSLLVRNRATGAVTTRESSTSRWAQVEFLGDWVLTGEGHGLTESYDPEWVALIARTTEENPTTVRLLDHLVSWAVAPDGSVLARGGSQAHGEGLYRIALGADGRPAATFLAGSGESAGLGQLVHTGTAMAAPRDGITGARFSWEGLTRRNVKLDFELRHVATGKSTRQTWGGVRPDMVLINDWHGLLYRSAAPSGAYTWKATVTPLNGVGEPLHSSGSLSVSYRPPLHDFTSNGSADVLARDTAGRLWLQDSYYHGKLHPGQRTLVGTGWQVYDRIEAVGNIGGSDQPDLVARDRAGVLWRYEGKGDGTFAPRGKVGGGWNAYDRITGGSDLNGDGRADLVATDRQGGLWLYPGTGDLAAPYAPRKKIGTSWGVYNLITATGDIAGGEGGDLVARDRSGVLWLYLGKGDGTFASRVKVGRNWNIYTDLVSVGQADRHTWQDVVAVGPEGALLHNGDGRWDRPFKPRESTGLFTDGVGMYDAFA